MGCRDFLPSVKKYTLNPGYQLCYCLGIRIMQELYEKYGQDDPAGFTGKVLAQGEIMTADLEQILKNTGP